jgi:hypothetical protein
MSNQVILLENSLSKSVFPWLSKFKTKATSQFQTLDQKAATEHVLDVQAEKKMDEEESGDPKKK